MFDPQEESWSDDPNTPKISYDMYLDEKTWFAGVLISSIFYGIAVTVFFKCMAALFNPAYRRGEPVRWGLVSYTVTMLLLVTIRTTMQLIVQSISYIDNREFPGTENGSLPGPYGYQLLVVPNVINVTQSIVFALSNWLADGLLLYRCYVIYSMNFWAIAFPCLMYLASFAMGTMCIYWTTRPPLIQIMPGTIPYFSISLSLNVILTLMIVVRLILHARDTRTAMGKTGLGGLYKAIVTILAESCALFAVNSLLYLALSGAGNAVLYVFSPIVGQTQVIAPLLTILRAANKSALTSETFASVHISELKVGTREELTGGGGAISGGDSVGSAGERVMNPGKFGVGVKTTDLDSHQDRI